MKIPATSAKKCLSSDDHALNHTNGFQSSSCIQRCMMQLCQALLSAGRFEGDPQGVLDHPASLPGVQLIAEYEKSNGSHARSRQNSERYDGVDNEQDVQDSFIPDCCLGKFHHS